MLEEADHIRDERSERLTRLIDISRNIEVVRGQKLAEALKSEEEIKKTILALRPEQFVELLNGVNGILRDKNRSDWRTDGDDVEVSGTLLPSEYIPPRQEDKESLFEELLSTAQTMIKEGRSLEDVALLIGTSINAIHAYADANGRTSRFFYWIIKNGYSAETATKLKELLGENGREIVDPNPARIKIELENILLRAPLEDPNKNPAGVISLFPDRPSAEYTFKEPLLESLAREFFAANRNDSNYFRIAFFEEIYRMGDVMPYIKEFPAEKMQPGQEDTIAALLQEARRVFILSRITPDLTTANVQNILRRYWQLKKEFVESLMQSIAHPESPAYRAQTENGPIALADLLKQKVQERARQ